jgi:amidase
MTIRKTAFMPESLPAPLRGSASGALRGLTVAIKDMYDIEGTRTSGGSPSWREAHPPASEHSGAVRRVLDAGATVIGKTICDEFFYSTTGVNAHYGMPINPNAPDRIPGGSSSGSASATAAGACDIAIGSDTGGSVRVPAALCGTYGIRATSGRFDFSGSMQMAPSFDAGGWFASSPGVFRLAGSVLLQGDSVSGEIERVVLLDDAQEVADDTIADLVEGVLIAAEGTLPPASRARASTEGLDVWREAMRIVQAYEVWKTFGGFIESTQPELGPGVRERMIAASKVTSQDADRARQVLDSANRQMEKLVPVGTILALPTTPIIAPLLNETPAAFEDYRVRGMRLSCITSISGLPQVTIPVGSVNSAPVGLSFIGWRGGDEALLDLAVSLSTFAGSAVVHSGRSLEKVFR